MTHLRGCYCKHCNARVLGVENKFNAPLHAGLIVFTLGLWLPFFFIAALWHSVGVAAHGRYLCQNCGSQVR